MSANGIINVYKPSGITSHDAVNRIRRIYGTKKVGHTGTLDPMASGVLPVLVGNAVKASEYVMSGEKRYVASVLFGTATDTEDSTGVIVETSPVRPDRITAEKAAKALTGRIMQRPPIYSAIKKNGKKLYELAREGTDFVPEEREVEIRSIEITSFDGETCVIDVVCSKGTYIRSLVRDMGKLCGTCAVMTSLERVASHGFTKENSFSLEDLEKMDGQARLEALVPVESIFTDAEKVKLNGFYGTLAKNGAEIYLDRAGIKVSDENRPVLLYDENGAFFALGRISDFPQGRAVKSVKMFL